MLPHLLLCFSQVQLCQSLNFLNSSSVCRVQVNTTTHQVITLCSTSNWISSLSSLGLRDSGGKSASKSLSSSSQYSVSSVRSSGTSNTTAFFTLKSSSMATSVSVLSSYHPGSVLTKNRCDIARRFPKTIYLRTQFLEDHMDVLVPKPHHMVVYHSYHHCKVFF